MLQRIVFATALLLAAGGSALAQADCNGPWLGRAEIVRLEAPDIPAAMMRLNSCAEMGDAGAQMAAGEIFEHGVIVEVDDAFRTVISRDHDEAGRWFLLAAEQNFGPAQFKIAGKYSGGVGVGQDAVLALMWASIAVANGFEGAAELRDELVSGMTTDDVALAMELADERIAAFGI